MLKQFTYLHLHLYFEKEKERDHHKPVELSNWFLSLLVQLHKLFGSKAIVCNLMSKVKMANHLGVGRIIPRTHRQQVDDWDVAKIDLFGSTTRNFTLLRMTLTRTRKNS